MKDSQPYMDIIYNKNHHPLLYGVIRFFKSVEGPLIRSSSPFVIGKYNDTDRFIIYGSIYHLLTEIKRLINGFLEHNRDWGEGRMNILEYEQYAKDFMLLVSIHARNLKDLINDKDITDVKIPLLDYEKQHTGDIQIKEILNRLIHNRYYFFDASGIIRDLFSDQEDSKSPIGINKFMGYGIDIFDYVKAIRTMVNSIRIRHLTSLLRCKINNINVNSKKQDIIFLVQNTLSFSHIMVAPEKIKRDEYKEMLQLMFHDVPPPEDKTATVQHLYFSNPSIKINPNLILKSFDINVDCGESPSLMSDKKITIEYERFFDMIDRCFGEDCLIDSSEDRQLRIEHI